MNTLSFFPLVLTLLMHASSLKPSSGLAIEKGQVTRRGMLRTAAATSSSLFLPHSFANAVTNEEENPTKLTDVYFGVGCFWHIQHEFVEAEAQLLKRTGSDFTSRTGYAGGLATEEGKVCYHNWSRIADYGKLGHGEVVGMTIPESSIGDFAKVYFSLFTDKGERVDPMDRGGEYRSLLGLPGGSNHPMYPTVLEAANEKGVKLVLGKGNDPDTLGKKMVFVMDSNKFPFYQAEVYHQFHDDFQSPAYGKAYNDLVKGAFRDGRVKDSGCPDRFPTLDA